MDIFLFTVPLAGEIEEFSGDHLYPYRWPIGIGLIIGIVAATVLAYRAGMHRWAWERRLYTGPALVLFLIVALPIGYYTISPLVTGRSTLCEASPIAGAGAGSEDCIEEGVAIAAANSPDNEATDAPADTTDAPDLTDAPADPTEAPDNGFEAQVAREGDFEGADDFHFGDGKALLIQTGEDEYVLRFEEFTVRNGPDLFVVLSPSADGYADGALNLGELKATDGAFNYDIPAGTDLSQFQSAVVWCRSFNVDFATAAFE